MAAFTSRMMSFLTTTTTTNSIATSSSPSSSSNFNFLMAGSRRIKRTDRFLLLSSPTDSNPVLSSKLQEEVRSAPPSVASYSLDSASDVVRRFYDGVNSRNLSKVVDLIADDCVYEDLVFPQPFIGRKAILEFFEKFMYTISKDLQFAIDDISGEDTSAVGVTWHLDVAWLDGKTRVGFFQGPRALVPYALSSRQPSPTELSSPTPSHLESRNDVMMMRQITVTRLSPLLSSALSSSRPLRTTVKA